MRCAMGDSRIKDVSSLLSSFFNSENLRQGERFAGFFASWPSFVGPRLAAHSRVADIDKGLLIIEAEHPGWIQLLQMRQTRILEDVAKRYPELALRGIAFRLSGNDRNSQTAAEPVADETEGIETPPDTSDGVDQPIALDEIGDPEFRALLKSLKDAVQGKLR